MAVLSKASSSTHTLEDFLPSCKRSHYQSPGGGPVVLLPGLSLLMGVLAECLLMASHQCLVKRHHLPLLWDKGPLRSHLGCGLPDLVSDAATWSGQSQCSRARGEGTPGTDPC